MTTRSVGTLGSQSGPRARGLGNPGVKSVGTVPRCTDGRFVFVYGVFFLMEPPGYECVNMRAVLLG